MGTYSGTYSADTITPDFVSAGVGRDPVGSTPSAAADRIDGAGGNDIIDGGGGGDVIDGGDGSDTIYDRPAYGADDLALTANASNAVHGDAGNDTITIEIGDTGGTNVATNAAYGDDGNDEVTFVLGTYFYVDGWWPGSAPTGSVSLYGGAGNDRLAVDSYYVGAAPEMTVFQYGGEGDDELRASADETDPDGSVWGMNNIDNLFGGAGDDQYLILEAQDQVVENAGEGNDTVTAIELDYTLPANVENLVMSVGAYNAPTDTFSGTGNAASNRISVGEYATYAFANYILDGKGGNDVMSGSPGAGNDDLGGNDTMYGGTGDDLIYGGGGDSDTWDGDDALYGDDGNDKIFGSFGNDLMYGGTGVDELGGQAGNDTMYGGAGKDKLGGGTGNDLLYGDADADVLSGREGLDRLTGGTGNDTFDYDAVTDSRPASANRDVILDFVGVGAAVGDRIDLLTIDANTSAGGNQAFAFRGTASFTKAGQVRVVASGSDTLIQANTGGTLAPELEILVKDGTATPAKWVAGDFIL